MKRAAAVLSSALLTVLITAGTALAQSDYPISPTTSVADTGGGNTGGAGGTAFTGGDLSFGTIAFATLLVVGVAAMFVARRRAARLAG